MIPVLDLYFKQVVRDGLEILRSHQDKLEEYFSFVPKDNIIDIKHILNDIKLPVLTGFPIKENKIPCIIVQISGEQETPYGLGDGIDENYPEQARGDYNYLTWEESKYIRANSQFKANIRFEIWSDNAVMVSLLYAVVKYCLLRAKVKMYEDGFLTPSIGGGDLEPIPDYLPIFIYRKALTMEIDYVASYHVGNEVIGGEGQFNKHTTIDDINIDVDGY